MRSSKAAAGLKLAAAAGIAAAFALAGPGGVIPAARAQTPGEACLFSAPYGAVPSFGLVGHIGWGFRGGAANNWIFGATEGVALTPFVFPGGNTNTWQQQGSFQQMLDAFGTGVHNGFSMGRGYYLQYRCAIVPDSNPTAAINAAAVAAESGYNLAKDNCLDKAVAILTAYQTSNMVPPFVYEFPNYYFRQQLPPAFGAVGYFTTLTIGAKLVDPLHGDYLNTLPLHTERPMRIQVHDGLGNLVFDSGLNIPATVTPNTDRYQGTVQLPSPSLLDSNLESWSGSNAGIYTVTVTLATSQSDTTRGLTLPSSETVLITQAAANTAADISLYAGDISGDGNVDNKDYQALLQCFNDLGPPKCDPGSAAAADLDDDGLVDGVDYNELLRVVACVRKIEPCT